ncbi:endonuclease/exonuclease/phosphatase family protein [Aestuariibacter sp. A3R04]|uniref:endonuclease/exonuclease/phosphatase family protein n=1 Tax=Aestuariibacter sp. A3R04 TaxID=2841571 RepID=UPI001C09C372|nr:endonuclease/exonuclease/phosphatase family protein [Aestuariibacter sp. A3R04]MBU3023237.1 endonuclease/exonuclease/phosphatase family protein [Aestuariibacter sp. A3R04]
MLAVLLILSALLLFTTLCPHIPGKHWLIRVWEFPRLQQTGAIVLLIMWWCFYYPSDMLIALSVQAMLLAACCYQLLWILPYTPIWRTEVPNGTHDNLKSISLLTSNVYMYNTHYQGLIKLIYQHQPDIIVTLESDKHWERALYSIHSEYPHRLACPLDNLYGMHLYSKFPFSDPVVKFRVKDGIPSMDVTILLASQPVKLHFVHPEPPSPTEATTAEARDKELTLVAKEVAKLNCPYIVTGDLNDVAWSPTTRLFKKLSGAKDPRIGRGFYNTFHAKSRWVRWPLDHVFHSPHFSLVEIKRLPGYGSDHFPLFTKLRLKDSPCTTTE